MKHPAVSREDVVYFVCRFRSLDTSKLDARRRLIDSFVNAVTIFDDYILITFNYKEGETRIDFTDIESSDLQSVGGPNNDNLNYIVQVGNVIGFIISIEMLCETYKGREGPVLVCFIPHAIITFNISLQDHFIGRIVKPE